ncbi:DUF4830 domain-containing protein [Paenibacillus sambharensis]|uniref:DUF4830 domain-containing protein n=1 Tax=Paenibacillus sambharensis TaxID=1803190 RepID=UPI0015E8C1F7|nr:DUF4830 domain-containing protein [Paenibacillus sambharensis]
MKEYGWHIDTVEHPTESVDITLLPEAYEMIRNAGLDLEPYQNQSLERTTYVLKERQATGLRLYVMIYEKDGRIIGGIGTLEDWTPGVFNVSHKQELRDDNIISGRAESE